MGDSDAKQAGTSTRQRIRIFEERFLILRSVCVALAALVWVTGPLWFGSSSFPQVPFAAGISVAPIVQQSATWLLLIAITAVFLFAERAHVRKGVSFAALLLLGSLIFLDQHRLQPWALHFFLLILLCAFHQKPANALKWMTAGIYFHSAVSKLDFEFINGAGFYLVQGLADAIGMGTELWSPSVRIGATVMLPVVELLVAILLVTRFQRWGWIGAVAMHAGLLSALFQLSHKPAVLIWNVWFIFQALCFIVFVVAKPGDRASQKASSMLGGLPNLVGCVAVSVVCVLPFLNYEPLQIVDNWPSWALYSTKSERVGIFVSQSVRRQLPESMQPFVSESASFGLHRIKADRWSLDETGSPMYPEDRFWTAVALRIAEPGENGRQSNGEVVLQIESPANRFSGKRQAKTLRGRQQIEAFAETFWLNAKPAALSAKAD